MRVVVDILEGAKNLGQVDTTAEVGRTLKIGRLKTAHIRVDDPAVARIHAVVECGADGLSLIDMGSGPGTLRDGERIHKCQIRHGDRFQIGATTLVFGLEGAVGTESDVQAHPLPPLVIERGGGLGWGAEAQPAATPHPDLPPQGGKELPLDMSARTSKPTPRNDFVERLSTMDIFVAQASDPTVSATAPFDGLLPGTPAPRAQAPTKLEDLPLQSAPAAFSAAFDNQTDPDVPRDSPSKAPPARAVTPIKMPQPVAKGPLPPALLAFAGIPPEGAVSAQSHLLEVRLYVWERLWRIETYREFETISIGDSRTADFMVHSEGLPVREFPLLRKLDLGYVLTVHDSMHGEVELDGKVTDFAELREDRAVRNPQLQSCRDIRLAITSRAVIHYQGLTFTVRCVPPTGASFVETRRHWDFEYLNTLSMAFFLHLSLLLMMLVYPSEAAMLPQDMYTEPSRWTQLILEPPKPKELPKRMEVKKELKAVAKAIERQVLEQKLDSVKAPPATKQQARQQAVAQAFGRIMQSAVLGSVARPGANLAGLSAGNLGGFGAAGGVALGGLQSQRGVIFDAQQSFQSLSTGLSSLNLGQKAASIQLAKSNTNIKTPDAPTVTGSLPKEAVKRIIDLNAGQVRACYEAQLQRNPNLAGQIRVRWVIGKGGKVEQVNVESSTLENAAVETCITGRIRQWKFDEPSGGGVVEIAYGWSFTRGA